MSILKRPSGSCHVSDREHACKRTHRRVHIHRHRWLTLINGLHAVMVYGARGLSDKTPRFALLKAGHPRNSLPRLLTPPKAMAAHYSPLVQEACLPLRTALQALGTPKVTVTGSLHQPPHPRLLQLPGSARWPRALTCSRSPLRKKAGQGWGGGRWSGLYHQNFFYQNRCM